MSKDYSPKVERQIIRRIIRNGLFEDEKEALAQLDDEYEKFLEQQERKALRKKHKNKRKDWDDDYG